jgi:hypothetical protein
VSENFRQIRLISDVPEGGIMGHLADNAERFITVRNNFEIFTFLADQLAMPEAERRGILGLDEDLWRIWLHTSSPDVLPVRATFERRMAYAIRLMERMIENGFGTPPDANPLAASHGQQQRLPA